MSLNIINLEKPLFKHVKCGELFVYDQRLFVKLSDSIQEDFNSIEVCEEGQGEVNLNPYVPIHKVKKLSITVEV